MEDRGDPILWIGGAARSSDGAGGGGTWVSPGSGTAENEDRDVADVLIICENGFPGPAGASAKVWATAELGWDLVENC